MEMVLEGSILQMMATVLKLLPIEDLIKHFCIYSGIPVNFNGKKGLNITLTL